MSAPTTRQADALAPAGFKQCWNLLKSLPSAPSRARLTGLLLIVAATVALMNLGSQLLGRIVDIVQGQDIALIGSGRGAMVAALGVIAFCLVAEVSGRTLVSFLINSRVRRLSMDLRTQALSSVLRAPVPRILELGTGNVITRLSKDIDTVVNTITTMGDRLLITVFMLPLTALALIFIHPAYGVLFLLAAAMMYPFVKGTIRDIPAVTNVVSSVEARRNSILLDTIRALDTLRHFRLGTWAARRMERYSWETVQSWADRIPLFTRILAQGSIAYGFLLIGIILMSVPMVSFDWISQGEAAAAVLLVTRLEIHVFNLLFFAGEIQHAGTSLGRAVALTLLDDVPSTETTPPLKSAPSVRIAGLYYSYPGGASVLRDINLELEAGTTTALVGTSGAGKSTLAALVAGLQYPDAGQIFLGEVDTAATSSSWLSRHVALVTQEVHLFSGTLREDLLLARPAATDSELWKALHAVGLDESSRWLPEGLDTAIGAGNPEVGPEAAQQLSLARMLLRQPPVLIMDEATSEAGSEHAEVLEEAARKVTQGRTCLVVAHRLDQARSADRILVMEAGRIVEDGDHASLIAAGGRYARGYTQWEHGQES
nr:ABC transporter ATP-binding protein [Corynebacterium sp. UBA5992]